MIINMGDLPADTLSVPRDLRQSEDYDSEDYDVYSKDAGYTATGKEDKDEREVKEEWAVRKC